MKAGTCPGSITFSKAMPSHPRFPVHYFPAALAALTAALLGGASFGESIGTEPVVQRDAPAALAGSLAEATYDAGGEPAAAPPERYMLIAQGRRVAVGELATRGLHSQARFRGESTAIPDTALPDPQLATWDESTLAATPTPESAAETPPQVSPLPHLTLAD